MAAECSWSASSARLTRRDLTNQADSIAVPISQLRDPHFAPVHARNHVGLGQARRAGGLDRGVARLDVADVVKKNSVLLVTILTLRRRSRQHQSNAAAVKERERRRRIEKVRHAQDIFVETLRLVDVAYGDGDLFDAGQMDCGHGRLRRSLARLTILSGTVLRNRGFSAADLPANYLAGS